MNNKIMYKTAVFVTPHKDIHALYIHVVIM